MGWFGRGCGVFFGGVMKISNYGGDVAKAKGRKGPKCLSILEKV